MNRSDHDHFGIHQNDHGINDHEMRPVNPYHRWPGWWLASAQHAIALAISRIRSGADADHELSLLHDRIRHLARNAERAERGQPCT